MRRPLFIGCAAVVIALLAVTGWRQLTTDEDDRVRALVQDAAAAFCDGDVADCLDAFDVDWSDRLAGRRVDREMLRSALLYLTYRTRKRSWLAELPGPLEVRNLDPDAGTADVGFDVRLLVVDAAGKRRDQWTVHVDATVARGDSGAWRFARSTHETLAGAPPRF